MVKTSRQKVSIITKFIITSFYCKISIFLFQIPNYLIFRFYIIGHLGNELTEPILSRTHW